MASRQSMRWRSFYLALIVVPLAGCAANGSAQSSQCVKFEAGFCIGIVAAAFDVRIERATESIDGSTFVVKGRNPDANAWFVALVRQLDAPAIQLARDRKRLCEMSQTNAMDCGTQPIKAAKHWYYVLHSKDGQPYQHGIRVDLLSSNGVSSGFVRSLAYPCAVLTDGGKVCGPHLGTCIQWGSSDRCDFRDNAWAEVRKWWDRSF